MNTIGERTQQAVTRRSMLKSALAIGATGMVAAVSGNQALAATTRRRTTDSSRRRGERRDRDRHPRHARHPRVSAHYDLATNSVIVSGSKFSASARVDIKVDYDWPYLNYSVPWPIPTASAIDYTNNQGRFTYSVPVNPLGHPFTGRVEVTDSITTNRVSKNFTGS